MQPITLPRFEIDPSHGANEERKKTEGKESSTEKLTKPTTTEANEAKALQEMFVAGATSGGVARLVFIAPLDKPLPTQVISTKYPANSSVEKLGSPLEIKKWWLYNEWNPKCQFSKHIQKEFRNQADIHPHNGNAETKLIESIFSKCS